MITGHGQETRTRRTSGPVTLAESRALAKVRALVQRGAKVVLVPASPAKVGLERRKLKLKQAGGSPQANKEYKATLAIMKKRGVKGAGAEDRQGRTRAKGGRQTPLNLRRG